MEDVDLIAEDRSFGPGPNPFLFELLNEMDGVASDADVTFVLTTNRVDVLERALIDRPGRVDLAIEIPKPDAELEGVTASFVRELVRRAVLQAAEQGGGPPMLA